MLVALLAAIVERDLSHFDVSDGYRYAAKLVKYIAEGYMEVAVVTIVGHDYQKSKLKIIWAPYILISLFLLTAPINPALFYFNENHEFVRGPLGAVIFLEAAIYASMALAVCGKKWLNGYQRDAVIILFMLAVVSTGIFLEEANIYESCAVTSSAIGILFVYVYLYAERYNVDSVSMCYKRRCFYADANKYAKTEMAIISMDLNDLKFINDNFGHKAGDIALLTFAEVCRGEKNNKFILYRTGGDEFMMLGIKVSREEAQSLVDRIKAKLAETPYTCSFGLNMYKPGDDFDEAVVQADKAMYDDKNTYKASRSKRSRSRTEELLDKTENFTNDIKFLD